MIKVESIQYSLIFEEQLSFWEKYIIRKKPKKEVVKDVYKLVDLPDIDSFDKDEVISAIVKLEKEKIGFNVGEIIVSYSFIGYPLNDSFFWGDGREIYINN